MTGTVLHIDLAGLGLVTAALNQLTELHLVELREGLGALVESQTRRRLADEKTAPDGTRWAGWSEKYGSTRRSGQSILVGEGDLLDSIHYRLEGDEVQIGSNLVYAAIHQFGGEEVGMNIPARPFLGLSASDKTEVIDLAKSFLIETVRGLN